MPRTLSPDPCNLYPPSARYYNSDLSLWLSVDPMADKYPNLSPYAYCANNPVRLADPNGREVYINGDDANDVVNQLENQTSDKFTLIRDNTTGKLTYDGKAKTYTDRFIKRAIDSKNLTIRISAKNNQKTFQDVNGKSYEYQKEEGNIRTAGAYGGSSYNNGYATAYQYVDPYRSAKLDRMVGDDITGGYMLHELAEGYYSAKMAFDKQQGDPINIHANYDGAHRQANNISGGGWSWVTTKKTINGLQITTGVGWRRSPLPEEKDY